MGDSAEKKEKDVKAGIDDFGGIKNVFDSSLIFSI